MSKLEIGTKRVVILFWKNRDKNRFEIFSNLKNVCLSYPRFNYNTLNNYLSKAKTSYENEEVCIQRNIVITRQITTGMKNREISPVVRKQPVKVTDEAAQDLTYWLSQPVASRLEAITYIVSQTIGKGQVMDKTFLVKSKYRP